MSSSTYLGTIACSETVTFGTISPEDITITIDGPMSPYLFEYKIDASTGFSQGLKGEKFKVQFTFKSSLAGKNKGKFAFTKFKL